MIIYLFKNVFGEYFWSYINPTMSNNESRFSNLGSLQYRFPKELAVDLIGYDIEPLSEPVRVTIQ